MNPQTIEDAMKRLSDISIRDCEYNSLSTYEKRLVVYYITEVMSQDEMAWKLVQLWIDRFSRDYQLKALPTNLPLR